MCSSMFKLLMNGISQPYVLWPVDKKLISKLVTRVRTPDYTVSNYVPILLNSVLRNSNAKKKLKEIRRYITTNFVECNSRLKKHRTYGTTDMSQAYLQNMLVEESARNTLSFHLFKSGIHTALDKDSITALQNVLILT